MPFEEFNDSLTDVSCFCTSLCDNC